MKNHSIISLQVADINGDGRLDIVNPFVWQTPRVELWLNQAAGNPVQSSLKGTSQ